LNVMKCAVSTFVSHTWSARPDRLAGEQGGEHRGNRPSREVFPLAVSRPVAWPLPGGPAARQRRAKPLSRGWLRRSERAAVSAARGLPAAEEAITEATVA
jgi:hypothetical protein